ncbi:MAG: DUF937 domain-containing protein [Actinomycetota bacterium]|nr:DUF937 domain-containing protein [Actinomycetota bacterium]
MTSMIESVLGMLTGDILGNVSKQIGMPEEKTQQVLPDVIALITSALAKNSSNKRGAQALSKALAKDHDGSLLNNIIDYIGNYMNGDGDGILKHVLGGNRTAAESVISKKTGIDTGTIGNLLTMVAPLIMGILGKTQKQQGFDFGGLADILKSEQKQAKEIVPEAEEVLKKKPKANIPIKNKSLQKKKPVITDIRDAKVPQDVFDFAEAKLKSSPDKYKNVDLRCQFDITGKNGGKWYVLANDKKKIISKGIMENPISTVIISDDDFIKMVRGELNAPMAVLTGKVKITGDMNHIVKLVETLLNRDV